MTLLQDMLTPSEVEEKYHVSRATLATWRSRKKGPTWVKRMGRVYYQTEELNEWVKVNTVIHRPNEAA